MLKKRPKKSFFWLLRGILGPNRHQKVFKRPITHLKTSQEFKFPIKNLPRWLLLPQKCKKWWYAIRAPCVRRPKTIKIKNFKKSSKNFLFFGVFQLNIHPLWGSKAQSWTSFKLNLMSARDPQCKRTKMIKTYFILSRLIVISIISSKFTVIWNYITLTHTKLKPTFIGPWSKP